VAECDCCHPCFTPESFLYTGRRRPLRNCTLLKPLHEAAVVSLSLSLPSCSLGALHRRCGTHCRTLPAGLVGLGSSVQLADQHRQQRGARGGRHRGRRRRHDLEVKRRDPRERQLGQHLGKAGRDCRQVAVSTMRQRPKHRDATKTYVGGGGQQLSVPLLRLSRPLCYAPRRTATTKLSGYAIRPLHPVNPSHTAMPTAATRLMRKAADNAAVPLLSGSSKAWLR